MIDDLIALAARKMVYLSHQQTVLTNNIANIDTPGYSPQRIRPFQAALDRSLSPGIAITHPNDIAPNIPTASQAVPQTISERAPDGNAVSLTEELAAVAKTQIEQQYSVNLFKSYMGMFTTALGPNI